MDVLLAFLFLGVLIMGIITIINPKKFAFWSKEKKRGEAAAFYFGILFTLLIVIALLTGDDFTVTSSVQDITTLDSVVFSGKSKNGGVLSINDSKYELAKGDFTYKVPLQMGNNSFKLHYKSSNMEKDITYSIKRTTEAELKKEKENQERLLAKAREDEAKQKEIEAKAKLTADRRASIEKQFSPWDGSHNNIERIIKQSMNDPSSYEHVSTNYSDKGNYIIVVTTFRGKNAFGAKVVNSARAKVSLDGTVLDIKTAY